MRNTEKVHRSAAPNLLIQFPLAELTLQLAVDPSKSRRSIPARADGRSQQKLTVNPSKSRPQEPTVDPDSHHLFKVPCMCRHTYYYISSLLNTEHVFACLLGSLPWCMQDCLDQQCIQLHIYEMARRGYLSFASSRN
jgi:hypothetical protein